jgi:uncharacterized protein YjbJ (UPF0337 family)
MHTNNRLQRHWPEVKEFIRESWPKFTDVELSRIHGDFDKFLGYLKEFYDNFPLNEALARDKLQAFLNKMDAQHPERTVVDR